MAQVSAFPTMLPAWYRSMAKVITAIPGMTNYTMQCLLAGMPLSLRSNFPNLSLHTSPAIQATIWLMTAETILLDTGDTALEILLENALFFISSEDDEKILLRCLAQYLEELKRDTTKN